MMANRVRVLTLAALLYCLAAAACSGSPDSSSDTASTPATGRGSSGLRILDGTDMASGGLRLQRISRGDGEVLEIHADAVRGLSTLYVSIALQAQQARLLTKSHPRLDGCSPLSLAVLHDGELQFGWVADGPDELFSGSGLLAQFALAPDDAAPETSLRSASKAVPPVDDLTRNARWNILSWHYLNPGDYDQNGIVGITDLTPLGQNFLNEGPFDPASAQWMVDGDGNGEINLADISVIGQNFGNTVHGYELYASPEGAAYPEVSAARLVAAIDTQASLGGGSERRYFSYSDHDIGLHDCFWVLPVGNDLSPSELTAPWEKQWHPITLFEFTSIGGTSWAPRTAHIDGRPAACWLVGSNGARVYYSIADNAAAGSWSNPVVIPTSSNTNGIPYMLDIGGRPGVFQAVTGKGMCYFEGSDAQGSNWSPELQVNGGFTNFMEYAVQTDNALHAISYRFTDDFVLHHQGNAPFPTAFQLENQLALSRGVDATSSGGRMMLAYFDLFHMHARFALFDISGSAMLPLGNVAISQEGDINDVSGLLVVNGLPRVWLSRGNPQRLYEFRATSADGTTWSGGQELDFNVNSYTSLEFMVANGGVYACGLGPDSTGLACHHSPTGEPGDWLALPLLEPGVMTLQRGEMLSVRGNPAVLYTNRIGSTKHFIYSVYY